MPTGDVVTCCGEAERGLILEPVFVAKKIDVLVAHEFKDYPEWIQALNRHLSSRVNPFANVVDMLAQKAILLVTSLLTLSNIVRAWAREKNWPADGLPFLVPAPSSPQLEAWHLSAALRYAP